MTRGADKGYRGAFILLYAFLAVLVIAWFAVYAIMISRGPLG